MVDLHSHILPCMDDGSKTIEESVKLMELELADGVGRVALTPHYLPERRSMQAFIVKRQKSAAGLKQILNASDLQVEIVTGAEVFLTPELLNEKNLGSLCYSGTSYMLVELPVGYYREWIPDILYQLRLRGISPVIAHIERYPYFLRHPETLYALVNAGAFTQVNADSILSAGRSVRCFLTKLMRHNLIHVIATDAHSVKHRPPHLKQAYRYIEKKYGQQAVSYFQHNAQSILSGKEPDIRSAVGFRKKLFPF